MSLRVRLRFTKMARSCGNFVCMVAHAPTSKASFFTLITLVTPPHERLMWKRVPSPIISPAGCCVPERRGWACCLAQQPSTRRHRPPQCTTACQTHADFLPAHRGPQCRPATQSPASAWNPACNHNTRAVSSTSTIQFPLLPHLAIISTWQSKTLSCHTLVPCK